MTKMQSRCLPRLSIFLVARIKIIDFLGVDFYAVDFLLPPIYIHFVRLVKLVYLATKEEKKLRFDTFCEFGPLSSFKT